LLRNSRGTGLYYGYEDWSANGIVDHPHERMHQHQNLLRTLARKGPDPEHYPNYPDVDVRDAISHYLVEVEVPGVKKVEDLHVRWYVNPTIGSSWMGHWADVLTPGFTSGFRSGPKTLIVAGFISRPEWNGSNVLAKELEATAEQEGNATKIGARDPKTGEYISPFHDKSPYVLVGERKVGTFR
jgi:hypothetical protein